MSELDPASRPSNLATSEDIPRAIEYLIQRVLRFACYGVCGTLGMVAFAAFWHGWSWWIVIPLLVLACAALRAAISIRPRGKIIFDEHGPIIVVPRPQASTAESAGGKVHSQPNSENS